jgi:hypothetical protein
MYLLFFLKVRLKIVAPLAIQVNAYGDVLKKNLLAMYIELNNNIILTFNQC